MKRSVIVLLAFILLLLPVNVLAEGDVEILFPRDGEGLKGRVEVTGYIKASNYSGFELDFSDEGNEAPGWYPILSGTKIADNGVLGIWDTTTISDGNYSLRLTVKLNDGTTSTDTVTGIRVRNYSPMEPGNPAIDSAISSTPTIQPTSLLPAAVMTVQPERNPAEITTFKFQATLVFGLVIGLIAGVLLFLIFKRQKSRS